MASAVGGADAGRVARRSGVALLAAGAMGLLGCGGGIDAGSGATASGPSGSAGTFAGAGLLVRAAELRARPAADTLVVDARPAAEHDKGHIPGAVSLPVSETFDPARDKNYPDATARLEALLGSKGIGAKGRVVVYDNGKETPAARLFWTLEYLGRGDVAVLDGGLKAWQAVGGVISTEPALAAPAQFRAAIQPAALHHKADCERMLGDRGAVGMGAMAVMVDARSPEEYRGEDVRAKYSGRIPGAVNVDWRECFGEDGLLKPPAALRALYSSRGVTPEKEVVAYCQTGQRSSVTYWTLRLLGYPRVANYAGSWVEWGNDPATPKAQGA